MKNETEIRERIVYWREIREGILVGKSTKKTVKHLIEELLRVLGGEDEIANRDIYYAIALLEMEGRIIEIDCTPFKSFTTAAGAETSISVPEEILEEADISSDEISKINTSRKEPRAKILVVDDEERYLDLVSHLLTGEGYEVNTAVDGIDALVKIKTNRYNLLLTGIYMPYMDGFELYKYVKRIDPSLANKAIVISGSINDENTREFVTENKLTFMAKPFNATQLKKTVNRNCHNSEAL